MLSRLPEFDIGDIVKFEDSLFTGPSANCFEAYEGHEFKVIGYALDDDDRPLHDHLLLRCVTGNVEVKGAPHDSDLVLVLRKAHASV